MRKTTSLARPFQKRGILDSLIHSWQLYVLLAPTIIYLLIFNYIPIYGVQIAFRDYIANKGIVKSPWVGLKHFRYFITSSQFNDLFMNTIKLSLLSLFWAFPFPIILALMLNEVQSTKYKKLVQNITYIPFFISTVVLVSMINLFFSHQDGIVNQIASIFGGNKIDFLSKMEYFRPLYIGSGIWQETGWSSIIYLASLSNIDSQLHEAAKIDGATRLQRLWYINIPCILPTVVIMLILRCGHIMNIGYEKVYLMQNSLNLSVAEVIPTYVYKVGLLNAQYSYTTAIGLLNNLINVIVLLITNTISRRLGDISLF